MKRQLLLCALVGLSPLVITPAVAETRNDVQELYQWCKDQTAGSAYNSYCLGVVVGVSQTLYHVGELDHGHPLAICGEPGPTIGAEAQAFINWAEKNPDKWGWPAANGVIIALKEKWPCKK
jgi:Rap1a immunity proteins